MTAAKSNATISFGEYNGHYGYLISATHTFAKPGVDTVKVTLFVGPINPASTLPTRTVETIADKAIVNSGGNRLNHPCIGEFPLLEIHEPAQQLVIRNAAQLKADTGLSEAGLACHVERQFHQLANADTRRRHRRLWRGRFLVAAPAHHLP